MEHDAYLPKASTKLEPLAWTGALVELAVDG